MTEEDIQKAVQQALAEVAPESAGVSLRRDVNFRDQFEFDSMDFVSFVIKLDQAVGRRTPEADYPRLSSLAGCISYLSSTDG